MSTRVASADGAVPSDEVLRLLRLLTRRGATIAGVVSAAADGAGLPVMAARCQVGLVAAAAWRAAHGDGLVRVADDGSGRIAAAGLALLRRLASAAGAPAATTDGAPRRAPASASGAAHDARGEPTAAQQPGFDADESPLAWLARRRDKAGRPLIEPRELDAGERFRADFHFAQMMPRVTANWSLDAPSTRRGGGAAAPELRDNVLAAQERVRRALKAVGPELAGVLVDVCGHLHGLEQAERGNGWPARSGKVVLQLALQSLARHYRLPGEPRSAGICRHWGSADYRPDIDG